MTITEILAVTRDLTSQTVTSFTNAQFLLYANPAKQEIYARLIALSKNLKFDSLSNSDLPVATFNLTNGINYYSFDSAVWAIDRVEIADNNGKFSRLTKIDEKDIAEALSEYQSGGGLPTEYSRRANSIFLYPTPVTASVTLAAGGKIYYQRGDTDWVIGDITTGTTTPGFAVPYHMLLCYKIALPIAVKYKPERVNGILNEMNRLEAGLFALESNKDGDKLARLQTKIQDNR